MGRIMFRLLLLTSGFSLLEQFLPIALVGGNLGWLAVVIGLALVIAGSAGFMVPLFDSSPQGGSRDPN
jgi:hypothetical protein